MLLVCYSPQLRTAQKVGRLVQLIIFLNHLLHYVQFTVLGTVKKANSMRFNVFNTFSYVIQLPNQNKQQQTNLEECCLPGRGAVWVYYKPMFWKNVSPPSSGQKK
jgi:DNA phosphorothioation-dependent restriction protein DptG